MSRLFLQLSHYLFVTSSPVPTGSIPCKQMDWLRGSSLNSLILFAFLRLHAQENARQGCMYHTFHTWYKARCEVYKYDGLWRIMGPLTCGVVGVVVGSR